MSSTYQRKQRKSGRKRKKKVISKKRRIIRRILLGLLGAILLVVGFFAFKYGRILYRYQKEAEKLVKDGGRDIFMANQTSTIYDKDGNVITALIGKKDAYYLKNSEIPYYVKSALITTEDRNFYSHSGIDYRAIARASVELIKHDGKITQGGSTITQQLARNVFLSHQVTFDRKLREMFIARELEKQYSKDDILEFYINNIYFGNGFYGIEAASKGYFNKSVTELSLAEIAFVCSIPNNPTLYDPYVNSNKTTERKNRILKQMYDCDDIDQAMYEEALTATIVLCPAQNQKNNYVETYVRYCATVALMNNIGFEFKNDFKDDEEKKKYENQYNALYDEVSAKLYTGGYKIYTSIDLQKQEELQNCIDEQLSQYTETTEDGVYTMQGASTCIDNETGKVVAIVGGRSQTYNGYTLNRAYQSFRQPGSTIKPILIYTPVFERKVYPETIVEDEPIKDGPVNSPETYDGSISIRTAVEKSKNTIAWNLFDELTPDVAISYLKKMEFKKIVPEDYVPAMSIGGMTYGVSTVEMASAYATIENDGAFRSPTCILKITDSQNNEIINNINYQSSKTKTIEEKGIYQSNAARTMIDVLKGVLIRGTGRNYNIDNAICAAKTGTTNDNKDVWFVGFSKYYTTSVWVGYDMPKVINDNYGTKCSGSIWQKFMSKIHEGLEQKDFAPYAMQDGKLSNGEETQSTQETESTTEESSVYQQEELPPAETTSESITNPETTSSPSETTPQSSTTSGNQDDKKTDGSGDGNSNGSSTGNGNSNGGSGSGTSGGASGDGVYRENWNG